MSTSISYKVTFVGPDQDAELRRFLVSQEAYGNFRNLQGKIMSVFPTLKNFSVFWTDNEGDNVTITSDEDLTIALQEMDGPVYKLIVKQREEDTSIDESPLSSEEEESIANSEAPVEDFQQWSGVFNDNTGTGTSNNGQANENQGQNMPPFILTILQFLGIDLNRLSGSSQSAPPNPTYQCPLAYFQTPSYHRRNCLCQAPRMVTYLTSQCLKVSAMCTKASITVSSIMIMLFIMMILPSFILHSALYLALAASLGLPLPTLITGHLLFAIISCSPTFLVATGSIWAFHRICVQKKPMLDVDVELWRRKLETLSTHFQQQQHQQQD